MNSTNARLTKPQIDALMALANQTDVSWVRTQVLNRLGSRGYADRRSNGHWFITSAGYTALDA
jgi:hypothetical protein